MKHILIITFINTLILTTNANPLSLGKDDVALYHVRLIAKMISVVQPELNEKTKNRIANSLYKTTTKYKIDPKLMIAIIGTESDFLNDKVSTTGDLSLAQINTEVWNKEFVRLGLNQLNSKLLKKDESYALSQMAMILNILKVRHAHKDIKWFARYHSHTPKFKILYTAKVEKRMRKIASIN